MGDPTVATVRVLLSVIDAWITHAQIEAEVQSTVMGMAAWQTFRKLRLKSLESQARKTMEASAKLYSIFHTITQTAPAKPSQQQRPLIWIFQDEPALGSYESRLTYLHGSKGTILCAMVANVPPDTTSKPRGSIGRRSSSSASNEPLLILPDTRYQYSIHHTSSTRQSAP